MSALSIQPTYPIFTETDGQPLEDGYIWLGVANLDPQGNPINVYWDAALTQLAGQPIRTQGGYPVNSGTPARLYVNSDYSIQVQNKNGSVVYSAPVATERYSDAVIGAVNAQNVVYDPPFVGGVQTNVESKLAQCISVKDFGAVGDGVTDDRTAIQDAFDSLSSGQTLDFGSGNVYLLSGTVTLDSKTNVKLTGESELRMVSGWIISGSPQNPAPPNNRIIQIKSCNGVTVDGLVLNGNMTNTPSHIYNGYGINAADSFDVRYENLTVKNLGGEGLMGEGTQRLWVTNCRTENVNHSVNVFGGCQQVFISNNYLQHNSFAVFAEGAIGVTVDSNICSQTAVYTSQPRAGIVLKNTAGLGDIDRVAISNNIVRTNNLDNANTIWCNGSSGGGTNFGNVLISNNELHSPFKWGIKAEGTYGLITATGNQIHDAGRDGTAGDSGGILGIIAATGNYISRASGATNANALRNVGIAANNYTTGFFNEKYINDRTVVGVAQLTGNYPLNTGVFFKTYDNTNPSVLGKQTVVTRDDDNGIVYGFADGVEGQIVTLIPRKTYTVYHNSGSATQKIYTLAGSDLTLTAWTSARFYFNGTDWRQI
jgi:hypothetical protein